MIFKIILTVSFFNFLIFADTLKDKVMKDEMLSSGFSGFIEYENDKYLISTGIMEMNGNSIHARIEAIKKAKIIAQSELTKFIYNVNIESIEKNVDTIIVSKSKNKTKRSIESQYIELIKEKGGGILKNIIDIGKWKKNNEYFYSLGIKINN